MWHTQISVAGSQASKRLSCGQYAVANSGLAISAALSVQIYIWANIYLCKYMSVQIYLCANIYLCKYLSVQISICANIALGFQDSRRLFRCSSKWRCGTKFSLRDISSIFFTSAPFFTVAASVLSVPSTSLIPTFLTGYCSWSKAH